MLTETVFFSFYFHIDYITLYYIYVYKYAYEDNFFLKMGFIELKTNIKKSIRK